MPLATLIAAVGAVAGPPAWRGILSAATPIFAFILIPLLDTALGHELRNPTLQEHATAEADPRYRAVLFTCAAFHLTVLFTAGRLACAALAAGTLSTARFVNVAVSAGVGNGLSFTIAHELLHGRSVVQRYAASALLAVVGYGHWGVSHLAHHVKVATPEDPSTSRRGESLWAFIPRSVWGNLRDGYAAEKARRTLKGISFWSPRNRALWWAGAPVALAAAANAAAGPPGLVFFVIQAAGGILMLEVVNYIEHYGLQRRLRPGQQGDPSSPTAQKSHYRRYEPVQPRHSWNATTLFTNAVSFRLQRHSDHHAHSYKAYQILEDVPAAPQLPWGYPVMMLVALVPPLYRSVMHPLLDAAKAAEREDSAASSGDERDEAWVDEYEAEAHTD
jgi:alkane 1-monooxygenase